MVCLSSFVLCSLLVSAVNGFQLISPPRVSGISLRAEVDEEGGKTAIAPVAEVQAESSTPDITVAAPVDVVTLSSTPASLVANTMDEGIYNFNKKLIDTVYDIICFLYPVRGNDRDFARFYVLETVARVPYFAYLSAMHLRETFGERYGSMSERMRTQ
jgi:ubiquinol oxidase